MVSKIFSKLIHKIKEKQLKREKEKEDFKKFLSYLKELESKL